jgi:hypothetical protein
MEFSYYKKIAKIGEAGSEKKLKLIVNHKKLFSVPWLLCYHNLV